MRPGPPRGDSTTVELTVTDRLAASSAPGVPAVCGMPALLEVGESTCLELVLPHLEAGEVAIATAGDLSVRAPLPVGSTASVIATVASVTPSSVTCEVLVRARGTMVARGSVEHRVVDAATFTAEVVERQPATAG